MKHKNIKITLITKKGSLFVMQCHVCEKIVASASEKDLIPSWHSCNGE